MTRRTIVVLFLILAVGGVIAPGANAGPVAQSSPGSSECAPGELCVTNEGNVDTGPSARRGPVNDPGGAYVRSFIAMAVVAAVMVGYFMVAMGGRKLPFRRRAARA